VSNAIRYDSLLVRELARELNAVLAGARCDAAYFDRERLRLTLRMRAARRGGAGPPSLLWQLHPSSGHLTAAPPGETAGRAQLPASARIEGVSAPPDERLLIIELAGEAGAGTVRRIVVELMTNQWNAIAMAADGRIVALLRERDAGGRVLRAGTLWTAPARSPRPGGDQALSAEEWQGRLTAVPPGERLRMLPRLVAYTSPQNAGWILGTADVTADTAALEQAWRRYRQLVWSDAPLQAVLLRGEGRWQPYVSADWNAGAGTEAMGSLLEAFAVSAERADAAPSLAEAVDAALAVIADRIEAADRRARRLEEELSGAGEEAARLRRQADLLLSQLHAVGRGAETVTLDDFAGGTVTVALDPALGAAENAARLYDTARRRDRAAARIPALLASTTQEQARLEKLAERLRQGSVAPDEIARLRAADLQPAATRRRPCPTAVPHQRRAGGTGRPRLPCQRRADVPPLEPDDIWLHARDVAGAHVILRWSPQ
jgi:predicted ribosome quality control (RQC) complex YloA/Tae2 family protein